MFFKMNVSSQCCREGHSNELHNFFVTKPLKMNKNEIKLVSFFLKNWQVLNQSSDDC